MNGLHFQQLVIHRYITFLGVVVDETQELSETQGLGETQHGNEESKIN